MIKERRKFFVDEDISSLEKNYPRNNPKELVFILFINNFNLNSIKYVMIHF